MEAREKLIWLAVTAALLGGLAIAIVLLGGSSDDRTSSYDGVLVEAGPDRLLLRLAEPEGDREEIEFVVRPADRAAIDVEHLQVHVRDRLPTRIVYERDGPDYVARDVQDLPAAP